MRAKYINLINNLPPEHVYLKCPFAMIPEGITIHNTGNPSGHNTAIGEIEYMHRTEDYRSFHYAVDDEYVVQGIRVDRCSYHAGDGEDGFGNRRTISIEICADQEYDSDRFYYACLNAASLCAELLHQFWGNCDTDRIFQHHDFDYYGKDCPMRIRHEFGFDWFKNLVKIMYRREIMKKNDNIPASWSKEAVDWAIAKGIMQGDQNGNLKLRKAITREELVTMLYRFSKKK